MGKERENKDLCPGYVKSLGECDLCGVLSEKLEAFKSDGGIPEWVSLSQLAVLNHFSNNLPPCVETAIHGGERFNHCRFMKRQEPFIPKAQISPKDNPDGMALVMLAKVFCNHPLHKSKDQEEIS